MEGTSSARATTIKGDEVPDLQEEVILGKVKGEWPTQVFANMAQAVGWYEENDKLGKQPKVWLAKITDVQELIYAPPQKGTLVMKK